MLLPALNILLMQFVAVACPHTDSSAYRPRASKRTNRDHATRPALPHTCSPLCHNAPVLIDRDDRPSAASPQPPDRLLRLRLESLFVVPTLGRSHPVRHRAVLPELTECSTEFVEISSPGHGDSGTKSWCWKEQNKRVCGLNRT